MSDKILNNPFKTKKSKNFEFPWLFALISYTESSSLMTDSDLKDTQGKHKLLQM